MAMCLAKIAILFQRQQVSHSSSCFQISWPEQSSTPPSLSSPLPSPPLPPPSPIDSLPGCRTTAVWQGSGDHFGEGGSFTASLCGYRVSLSALADFPPAISELVLQPLPQTVLLSHQVLAQPVHGPHVCWVLLHSADQRSHRLGHMDETKRCILYKFC